MKKLIVASAALALLGSLSACSRKDESANAALSNDVVLNDEGSVEDTPSDNALDTGAFDNGTLDNAAAGNEAANAL